MAELRRNRLGVPYDGPQGRERGSQKWKDRAVYRTQRWQRLRKLILARDLLCKSCDNAEATQVDHIKPITQGGQPWDPKNLQGLCKPCHSRKTGTE